MKSPRLLACALLTLVVAMLAPQAASASSSQLSLFQDDKELLSGVGADPETAMSEINGLGADILRTNVIYGKVYKTRLDSKKPKDFKTSDPNNSHYDWSAYDRLVSLARAKGIKVQMTLTGPGPAFSSENPSKCKSKTLPCTWKPKTSEFAGFAAAAVKRYKGKIAYYSIWNEPNIGKTWLQPRYEKRKGVSGNVDYAAAKYRQLYLAGYKAVAKYDPARKGKVLFGEVPSIASPLPFIRATLCLDPKGNPFKGKLAKAQGCSGRVAKIPTLGMALHPYNQGALFGPQQKIKTKTALPIAYMPRVHRLLDGAVKRKRISSAARAVFITEFGFQSNPPDKNRGAASLANQARYINESDRLFFGDSRVKWVSQYEFTDEPDRALFNTGLRLFSGKLKPSYDAYRMPIVVTRRSASSVEVYGQVRPGASSTVAIQSQPSGGSFTTVKNVKTNSRGFFRLNVRKANAFKLKWRLSSVVDGKTITSRTATAGNKLVYYKN